MSQSLAPPVEPVRLQPLAAGPHLLFGVSLLLGLLAWLGVWFQMIFFAPRTAALFGNFHMRMPKLTELVMYEFWWMIPAFAVMFLLACLRIRQRWAWSFWLMVLPLLLNVLILVSLYLPNMELAIGLQQGLAANR